MSVQSLLAEGGFEVTGAYGRDYRNKAGVMADWDANKDFRIRATGQTISKSAAEKFGLKGKTIYVRYNAARSLLPIRV